MLFLEVGYYIMYILVGEHCIFVKTRTKGGGPLGTTWVSGNINMYL